MKILRTPERHFENLPDYPFAPNYQDVNGIRMHYVSEGQGQVVLCLHGEPSWSYLYRKMIPVLSPHYHVVAPDLVGFGKSDKVKGQKHYNFALQFGQLEGLLQALNLQNITLVCQDWGGLLGLSMVGAHPEWFARVVIMNTFLPIGETQFPKAFNRWKRFAKHSPVFPIGRIVKTGSYRKAQFTAEIEKAYNAPYPSAKYKGGARAFPRMVPDQPDFEGVPEMKTARQVLGEWQKPALVMFSDKDPIMRGGDKWFRSHIPTAGQEPEITIKKAGHFLQEDAGEEIAQHIHEFIQRRPLP